ncbi:ClpXP protease specificity-enhancing factor [Rhodocyclaceae bacterium SMB388]
MTTVSTKPYLVRAIYEWCVDQGFTPHLAVIVDERVLVPPGYAREGQIVLNLGPDATNNLLMGNDTITFQARFGGVSHSLLVPMSNVLAVYARENGQGMAFEADPGSPRRKADGHEDSPDIEPQHATDDVSDADRSDGGDEPPAPPRGSHLKIVK